MLERDTKQCDAWKDEVQNILIFVSLCLSELGKPLKHVEVWTLLCRRDCVYY